MLHREEGSEGLRSRHKPIKRGSSCPPLSPADVYHCTYNHMNIQRATENRSRSQAQGTNTSISTLASALTTTLLLSAVLLSSHGASAQPSSIVYPFAVGATRCYSCGFGNFSNHSGAEFCYACPQGTYNALNESTSCQPCKNKTYAPNYGMMNCLVCETADYMGASTCPPPPAITEYFGE
jgi:hypothetical protein